MKRLTLWVAALLLLTGCASVSREPSDLALIRVLGVDGGKEVVLTAVCGGSDQRDDSRGSAVAADFERALALLPWSGGGEELSLTGVSYLVVGSDVELWELLRTVLENVDLGASVRVWYADGSAEALLGACEDPTVDLELLEEKGITAPTVARAAAALAAGGAVTLPCLEEESGRLVERGNYQWNGSS